MKKILLSLTFLASAIFAADIEVSEIYVKQTPPNAKNTAIFLKIKNNTAQNVALVDAECDLSEYTEIHTILREGDKMTMIKVPELTINANSSLELKPGGDHIMLFDLKKPVTKDSKANLTLTFSNGESLKLNNIESKEVAKHPHR